jgi:LacI family transcriptional regulator
MATVTIKDVAERAGVSAKTVSRVINGEPHVRPEVRDAVMEVVRALDYRPNAFARGLSSSRSFLIGMFFDDPTSAYAGDLQRGALTRCRELFHTLLIEQLDPLQADWAARLSTTLREVRLGGAILTPPLCDHRELVAAFADHNIPVVRIAPDAPDAGTPQVRIDDRAAACAATERLLELGHRDIAIIRGNPLHSATARRWMGFNDALQMAGLAVGADRDLAGDFTFRSGLEAGERLLANPSRPSAVFASNDEMAFGVLVAAMRLGVAVPGELSVVGFDDAALSRMAWPQITTVRQPNDEMAIAAVDMLIGPEYHLRRGEAGVCLTLPYQLMDRSSAATYVSK